jgi:hypothetical protein
MITRLVLLSSVLFLGACASDPDRVAAQRSHDLCVDADRRADMKTAEEACANTLEIVRRAQMGGNDEATALYDLARIKRRLGKFDEAEEQLKATLALEEKLSGPTSERTGRRLAELAATLAQADRYSDGFPYIERLAPLGNLYAGNERRFVAALLYLYADKAQEAGTSDGSAWRAAADRLGYKPEQARWRPG